MLADYTELWVRHEMQEWGRYFTDDSDFIAHSGVWWQSRRDNVLGHTDIPDSAIEQKHNYTQEVLRVAEVTPDVALVHTRWRWSDFTAPGESAAQDRTGLITLVLVKRRQGWLIRAAHNTRVAEG